jgi:MinD-like ATPase involved in chromosome partitioning or flagellar assembly
LYIITFYSFKGGVGRTMALVNTAAELARRGRKVLLVDFDLEAPGLNTYELLRPEEPHPGIVEYVTEFRHTRRSPLVTDFVYEARPAGKKGGRLWVMPAGRGDAEYRRMLNALNWRTLYQDEEGFLLFEDTRLQWDAELRPDYVLIDARTGHTDIEGICTRQLADAVVVVFYPNEQNLTGLREVCRHIRAEKESGLKKEIKLHFVASNVPGLDDEHGLLRRRLVAFRNELTIYREFPRDPRVVIHRHEGLEMLEQPIFVLQRPRSRLAREYRRLVRRLIMENPADPDGASFYLQGPEQDRELRSVWPSARFPSVEGRLIQIASQFQDDPIILRRLARFHQGRGELDVALRRLDRVLQLRPGWPDALYERGRCRRQVRDKAGAAEDLLQYLRSPDYFRKDPFFPKDAREAHAHGIHTSMEDALTALQELIDVSFAVFVQALALPEVRKNSFMLSWLGVGVWLNSAAEYLLREHLWERATRYLETEAVEFPKQCRWEESVIKPPEDMLQGERIWYLAMAYWGNTGRLRPDLCKQAAEQLLHAVEPYPQFGAENCQRLSLLYWGVGDADRASAFLDRAFEESSNRGLLRGVSGWTFREASAHEFRQHCEEQRRMILGEPVRPPFLGEPAAPREVGGNER